MTDALILAAGHGTRLRPLTDSRPKCLVPLLGQSLLSRQVKSLNAAGIHNVRVVAGYCADQIQKAGFDCTVNPNYAVTNMVATLFSVSDYLRQNPSEDLIISYGDIVYQQDNLKKVLQNQDEMALMVDRQWLRLWQLRFSNPLEDAETLIMNSAGYIVELGKKPRSYEQIQAQYTGLIKVRADKKAKFIDFYHNMNREVTYDGQPFAQMYLTSFIQALIDDGWKVKGVAVENGWLEVDSVNDLKTYEALEEKGQLSQICKLT